VFGRVIIFYVVFLADLLASDISKKIQSDIEFPGQIKVTVIRETRAVSYA